MNTLGSLNLDQPMAGQGMITWLLGYLAAEAADCEL